MINPELIQRYGGQLIHLKKDEILFQEQEEALFYFQVEKGTMKMANYSYDGQEFIQGFFKPGESFGEPPLFAGIPYPSNAIAVSDATLWKLRKDAFFDLLKVNFEVHLKFNAALCKRLAYKSMILREISSYAPEHRIMTLIRYLKDQSGMSKTEKFKVPYTRQQIADMTGLRVETVIRTVKKLEEEGKVEIFKQKIYLV
jgi:CRP/FNR family transcriptional regulator, cyclic AMP receptor protein